jgi:hypothetical protein
MHNNFLHILQHEGVSPQPSASVGVVKSEAISKNEALRHAENLKVQHGHIIPF